MPDLFPRSLLSDTFLNATCPNDNTILADEQAFFSGSFSYSNSPHKIGLLVAAIAALITCVVAILNIRRHCRSYTRPLQQRQIVRILLMPAVFAVISAVGYRFYREYTYFKIIRDTYEAVTIAAFMLLMLLYLGDSHLEQSALLAKAKRTMVFPLNFVRYRPSKPKFLFIVKWSVLQFVLVKPSIAIAAIVTESLGVFCGASQSFKFANVYLEIFDFVSVTIALYGLITLYVLLADELKGRRPLSKFLTIKIIVALVFYQNFVFSLLAHYAVLKPTTYWTSHNVADGLNALVTTLEMILISSFQWYAFPVAEYYSPSTAPTGFWRSFAHSQNYSDFFIGISESIAFFFNTCFGRPYTKASKLDESGDLIGTELDFNNAFKPHRPNSQIGQDPSKPNTDLTAKEAEVIEMEGSYRPRK